MSFSQTIRLIIDPPQSGVWNMAVDEALMKSVGGDSADGQPVLRFYRWREPTLSLGYFQKSSDRSKHWASRNIAVVRRNSGGGAIIHDHELTYSITFPESALAKGSILGQSTDLYAVMHDTLIDTLSELGVQAEKVSALQQELESNFLCFSRRAPGDVLVNGNKVCGSAQRKKYNAISQHGSVILQTSHAAPEITGINNISQQEIEFADLVDRWIGPFVDRVGAKLIPSELSEKETKEAQITRDVKFSTLKWTEKR